MGGGGALYTTDAALQTNRVLFEQNKAGSMSYYSFGDGASSGGALYLVSTNWHSSKDEFLYNVYMPDYSTWVYGSMDVSSGGGAVYLSAGKASISDALFAGNGISRAFTLGSSRYYTTVLTGAGGGIYATDATSLETSYSDFSNNTAGAAGAIYCASSTLHTYSFLSKNDHYKSNRATYGGGLYLDMLETATVRSSTAVGNQDYTAGLEGNDDDYLSTSSNGCGSDYPSYGGFIFATGIFDFKSDSSTYTHNKATYGGALYLTTATSRSIGSKITSDLDTFNNNSAFCMGGAVYFEENQNNTGCCLKYKQEEMWTYEYYSSSSFYGEWYSASGSSASSCDAYWYSRVRNCTKVNAILDSPPQAPKWNRKHSEGILLVYCLLRGCFISR